MSNKSLKILALILIALDYINRFFLGQFLKEIPNGHLQWLYNNAQFLTGIALPIVVFLVVRSVLDWQNKVTTLFQLSVTGLITEPAFDWLRNGNILDMTKQSPVWGLLLLYIGLCLAEKAYSAFNFIGIPIGLIALLGLGITGAAFNVQYIVMTIVLGIIYFAGERAQEEYPSYLTYSKLGSSIIALISLIRWPIQWQMLTGMVPMVYNGQYGDQNRYIPYSSYIVIIFSACLFKWLTKN